MEDSKIRSLLGRTYAPFFSRFGGFTDIQREAIPPIIEGKNLFLISPAATGKTEAAAAPVIERLLAGGAPEPVAILYAAPTRALVNDLEKRLLEPVERTGLSFAVRTGERREIKALKPPHFLVTTPESLDSILCRTPRILKKIKAVILDELHLIDGTYRGDQMRILLNRLRSFAGRVDFQTVAMSATAPDPQKMGERYMADFAVAGRGSPKTLRTFYFEEIDNAVNFMKKE
ncbi:MAG: DEAD/DEAH box helicase, partial [Deltaproteobacteria bacterium]|nr:DEAD/DEAH box helicase [Deltaproteobacteria bacterium]